MSQLQKFYTDLFGDTSETETVAETVDQVLKSGADFIDRAILLFNRRYDLDAAYEKDTDALDGFEGQGGWDALTLLGGVVLLGAIGAYFLALAAPVLLAAVGVVSATAMTVGFIKEGKARATIGEIDDRLDDAYEATGKKIQKAIEDLQLALDEQTPDIRRQFNDAYNISLKKQQIHVQKRAAEAEVEALEDLADARRAQAGATMAAGIAVGSAIRAGQ